MKFIALGSNLTSPLGAPMDHLRIAAEELQKAGFKVIGRAPIYRTAPVPVSDQPDFLNSVLQVEFSRTPEEALAACHAIETKLGRVRSTTNEARIIDIDIITWDDLVQFGPPELPHPRMHERAFVIVPLADIAPDWRHPVRQEMAVQMKNKLSATGIQLNAEQW